MVETEILLCVFPKRAKSSITSLPINGMHYVIFLYM